MSAALIVIDVQRALFETSPPPADADAVLERINALADRARAAGAPVIYVQHETRDGAMAAGQPGVDLDLRLTPAPGDRRVRKTTPDSFLRTTLSDELEAAGASRLVICGYATEFCVDTTVRRAAGLGFPVTLAADAHTTHDKPHAPGARIREHHNATLPAISSFGVRIQALPAAAIDFPAGVGPDGSGAAVAAGHADHAFRQVPGPADRRPARPYLAWFARKGFPPGELGRLLALMHELDHNGLASCWRRCARRALARWARASEAGGTGAGRAGLGAGAVAQMSRNARERCYNRRRPTQDGSRQDKSESKPQTGPSTKPSPSPKRSRHHVFPAGTNYYLELSPYVALSFFVRRVSPWQVGGKAHSKTNPENAA